MHILPPPALCQAETGGPRGEQNTPDLDERSGAFRATDGITAECSAAFGGAAAGFGVECAVGGGDVEGLGGEEGFGGFGMKVVQPFQAPLHVWIRFVNRQFVFVAIHQVGELGQTSPSCASR